MTSNSLIPLGGNDTPQCQDGTLIRRGVGLTMAQLIHAGGKVVTRVLNVGYSGPNNPRDHIKHFFSEAERRERALDELYKANLDNLTKQHKQLLKHCHDILQYSLPTSTVKTQLITFRILVTVVTRYPGIRRLFLHPKCSKVASKLPASASHFENIWNRPHQQCGEEWTFYRDFAIYCLTDNGPLTTLVESVLPSKFGQLKLLGHNWNKDPIETLFSFCSADSPLNHEKLCAIRYLAGVLELPKFWRLRTKEGIDIAKRLFDFLSHLCETIFLLIHDMEHSSTGDSEDDSDPSPLWTSARSAADTLAFSTFGGFLQLHGRYEELPPCPSRLPSIVTLLLRPEMERDFPKASGRAAQVTEIIDWQQNAGSNFIRPPRYDESDRESSHRSSSLLEHINAATRTTILNPYSGSDEELDPFGPDVANYVRAETPSGVIGGTLAEETGRSAQARYSFDGIGEGELALSSGGEVEVLDDRDPAWWYVRDVRTGKEGVVPAAFLY